jgi:NADH-quinone oxidoreductase subunit E
MAVQLSQQTRDQIAQLIERYPTRRSVLLPALHLAMQECPVLDDDVCQAIADLLHLPLVDVKGVATFYTMFPTEPHGKYIIQLCVNLPCAQHRARHLLRYLEGKLGIAAGQTTDDGRFTLQRMECLAACDKAPMMYINDEQYNHLSEAKLDQILHELPE